MKMGAWLNRVFGQKPSLASSSSSTALISYKRWWIAFAAVCAVLFAVKICSAVSLQYPMQVTTTGCEEESLFAIWKFIHHYPVYGNPFAPPYALSFFNWLFYQVYGSVIKLVLTITHAQDAWIPTIGRLLTVFFCGVGGLAMYVGLNHLIPVKNRVDRAFHLALAVVGFFGLQVSFWGITVRPDILALALVAISYAWILGYYNPDKPSHAVWAALLFYSAWAVKQTFVYGVTGFVLSLVWCRYWRSALTVCLTSGLLYLVTFWIGGKTYFYSVMLSQLHMRWYWQDWLHNYDHFWQENFAVIVSLTVLGLSVLRVRGRALRGLNWRPLSILLSCGVGFIVSMVFASKYGASVNYFLSPLYFALILIALAVHALGRPGVRPLTVWVARVLHFSLMIGIACVLVMTLYWISIVPSIHRAAERTQHNIACLKTLPTMVMSETRLAMLPWNNNNPYPFQFEVAFGYPSHQPGVHYEYGGIRGLMDQGIIKTYVGVTNPQDSHFKLLTNLSPLCQGLQGKIYLYTHFT